MIEGRRKVPERSRGALPPKANRKKSVAEGS